MQLLKVFTKSETQEMNKELKEYMDQNKVLIAVFGYESVLINAGCQIYKSHGGIL